MLRRSASVVDLRTAVRACGILSTLEDRLDNAKARLGARLGNYILKEVLGHGGMGVVYRAEHVFIHKPAAVKVLHPRYFAKPEALKRFLDEARTASLIDHPNIVGVNDFGEADDGTVFLVMSYVEGKGLDRVLHDETRVALFRALGMVNQITRALAAAHAKGVVHRDLKPENIMLSNRPGRREVVHQIPDGRGGVVERVEMETTYDFVTILDFGAAKFWRQSTSPTADQGTVIGTPAYMAPETARTGVADARADIYAIGVIFYEMLTGMLPFDGENAAEIMLKHVSQPLELPRARNPNVEITEDAERVVVRALAKNPDRRYASMDEMNADLQLCYGSMRFRRANHTPPPGGDFETLRKPIPLTPDKVKRPTTSKEHPVVGSTPPARERPSGSGPVLLTKKKSEPTPALRPRSNTLQIFGGAPNTPGVTTPDEPDDE